MENLLNIENLNEIEKQQLKKIIIPYSFIDDRDEMMDLYNQLKAIETEAEFFDETHKEILQIERYRDDILDSSAYPKNKVCYKLILISSQITKPVRRKLEGTPTWKNPDDPFLYSVSTEDGADIKVYVMEWSELIEINKRKLAYLSQSLNVKPEDVGEKFAREYPKLLNEKSRNRLNQRSLK